MIYIYLKSVENYFLYMKHIYLILDIILLVLLIDTQFFSNIKSTFTYVSNTINKVKSWKSIFLLIETPPDLRHFLRFLF